MALTNTEKEVSQLVINKVPTNEIYQQMVEQNLINDDELYLIQDDNRLKVNGILKGDGAGGVSAAVANTDYATCTNLRNGKSNNSLVFKDQGPYNEGQYACSFAAGGDGASGFASFTNGANASASGNSSHAEGSSCHATGDQSHAEGLSTTGSGKGAHSEGKETSAVGDYSHAEGLGTVAKYRSQHTEGEFNIVDASPGTGKDAKGNYINIVGNGTSNNNLSNAHTLDWSGNAWFAGDVYVGSTSGTNKDDGSKKLVNIDEVAMAIADANETYFATQGLFESSDFTVLDVNSLSNICYELNNRIVTSMSGESIIPLFDIQKPCLIIKYLKEDLGDSQNNIILKYNGIGSIDESSKFTGIWFDVGAMEHYAISAEWDFRTSAFINKKIDKIEDKIFVATYGTTTYSEVYNAKQAGKIVICAYESGTVGHKSYYFYDSSFQQFITDQTTETVLEFTQGSKWVRLTAKNVWSEGVKIPTINGKSLSDTTKLNLGSIKHTTLTSSGWTSSSGVLTQTLTVSGLVATYNAAPTIDLALDKVAAANKKTIIDAWGKISGYMEANTAANSITFTVYADTAPIVDIPIRITTYD